jgi:hypothetical protein
LNEAGALTAMVERARGLSEKVDSACALLWAIPVAQ